MITRRLVITGYVQGVSYRGWMIEQARALGVAGWVRNHGDGSVEAMAEGPREAVEAIVAKCEIGPFAARVKKVVADEAAAGDFSGFEQRPDA